MLGTWNESNSAGRARPPSRVGHEIGHELPTIGRYQAGRRGAARRPKPHETGNEGTTKDDGVTTFSDALNRSATHPLQYLRAF